MVKIVKREDYSSEEEYQEAYNQMLENIRQHNKNNPEPEYDQDYKENFLRLIQN